MTIAQIRTSLAQAVKKRWFRLEGRQGGSGEWTTIPIENFQFDADLASIVSSLLVVISDPDWVSTCRGMSSANPLALGAEVRLFAGTSSTDAVQVFRGIGYRSAVTTVAGVPKLELTCYDPLIRLREGFPAASVMTVELSYDLGGEPVSSNDDYYVRLGSTPPRLPGSGVVQIEEEYVLYSRILAPSDSENPYSVWVLDARDDYEDASAKGNGRGHWGSAIAAHPSGSTATLIKPAPAPGFRFEADSVKIEAASPPHPRGVPLTGEHKGPLSLYRGCYYLPASETDGWDYSTWETEVANDELFPSNAYLLFDAKDAPLFYGEGWLVFDGEQAYYNRILAPGVSPNPSAVYAAFELKTSPGDATATGRGAMGSAAGPHSQGTSVYQRLNRVLCWDEPPLVELETAYRSDTYVRLRPDDQNYPYGVHHAGGVVRFAGDDPLNDSGGARRVALKGRVYERGTSDALEQAGGVGLLKALLTAPAEGGGAGFASAELSLTAAELDVLRLMPETLEGDGADWWRSLREMLRPRGIFLKYDHLDGLIKAGPLRQQDSGYALTMISEAQNVRTLDEVAGRVRLFYRSSSSESLARMALTPYTVFPGTGTGWYWRSGYGPEKTIDGRIDEDDDGFDLRWYGGVKGVDPQLNQFPIFPLYVGFDLAEVERITLVIDQSRFDDMGNVLEKNPVFTLEGTDSFDPEDTPSPATEEDAFGGGWRPLSPGTTNYEMDILKSELALTITLDADEMYQKRLNGLRLRWLITQQYDYLEQVKVRIYSVHVLGSTLRYVDVAATPPGGPSGPEWLPVSSGAWEMLAPLKDRTHVAMTEAAQSEEHALKLARQLLDEKLRCFNAFNCLVEWDPTVAVGDTCEVRIPQTDLDDVTGLVTRVRLTPEECTVTLKDYSADVLGEQE